MVRRGRGEIGKAGSAGAAAMLTNSSISPRKQSTQQTTAASNQQMRPSASSSQLDVHDDDINVSSHAVGLGISRELCEDARGGVGAGDTMQMKEVLSEREADCGLLSRLDDGVDVDNVGARTGLGGDGGEAGTAADDEAGVATFEAALALCADEGSSNVPVAALRELFAAAVGRAKVATDAREAQEDACNTLAADNQAIASELDTNRTAASVAQAAKHKYEVLCREGADINRRIKEQADATRLAEQERTEELVRKFESVAPSVKEKLAAEEDRRKVQRESNEAMRSKLDHFEKQTEITEEAHEAQLRPGSLEIQILEAQCTQQEAERRAYDARSESVSARLQTTRVAQAKMKKDATERERYLSKIQAVWNERKKTAASLEDQVKKLRAAKDQLDEELPTLRKAAEAEEAVNTLEKMVGRLQGLCSQLENAVEAKRSELRASRGEVDATAVL